MNLRRLFFRANYSRVDDSGRQIIKVSDDKLLNNLPSAVLLNGVCSFLAAKDILRLQSVNTKLHSLFRSRESVAILRRILRSQHARALDTLIQYAQADSLTELSVS